MLAGPLPGIYDPTGPGRILFAFFAALAETERDNIREGTLEGLDAAARQGKHGGQWHMCHPYGSADENMSLVAGTYKRSTNKASNAPANRNGPNVIGSRRRARPRASRTIPNTAPSRKPRKTPA